MTPHSVHHGHAGAMLVTRQATLDAAFLVHPNRFNPGGHPGAVCRFSSKALLVRPDGVA